MPFRASDSLLPLTPIAFEVLLALADDDLHGYAILQAVGERVQGVLPMRTGTLYRALASLLDHGLIDEIASTGDARRRVYRITSDGRSRDLISSRKRSSKRMVSTGNTEPGARLCTARA